VDAVGGEGQTGRHPVREKARASGTQTPEVHGDISCEVGIFRGREGAMGRETLFIQARSFESPRGQKAQESKRLRPELILRGQLEGHGFFRGSKPLKRRYEA
jgi:hypothetical protein